MRLLHITAGAGGMYCGSCLLDNALATELSARGHDVLLLPVYTPTLTDARNVSDDHVFFGGISVYLQQHIPLFRRTPPVFDRLWDAPSVIRAATERGISVDPQALGALTVSTLRGEQGFQAKEFRKLLAFLEAQPPFDLVVVPNSLLISLGPALRRALRRPVVCALQGEDLFIDSLLEPYRSEARTLIQGHAASVDAFVATSDYYAGYMTGYLGLDRQRVHAMPIGISLDGHAPRTGPATGPFTVGYLARIAPEKGLKLLGEAYQTARRELGLDEARLEVAGYLAPEHRTYLGEVRAGLEAAGLAGEFHYHGSVDRAGKLAFLQGLDVLSVPSPYAEPKGLYVLEALASGVPVIQPRHGAFPEVLARTDGGILFEPGDVRDLARRLVALAADREGARALGRRGADGVRAHHSIAHVAERALALYTAIVEQAATAEAS